MSKYHDTEGEKIIEYFLENENIKYKKQVKIPNLKGDYADYRVADFFIPKYKVYLEFLGEWNNHESRDKYKKKKELYKNSHIPCIYIYPDNLGTLQFLFYMRLREEFKKHPELKLQLLKYKLTICSQEIGWIWLIWFLLTGLVIFAVNIPRLKLIVTPISALLIFAVFIIAIILTIFTIKYNFRK
jgi:hypothetical protein